MGLLIDVVVTDPSNARKVSEGEDAFTGESMPGLSIQMLVALLAVLSNKRISKALHKEFPLLYGDELGDGPWTFQISDDLVKQLSKVKDSALSKIAEQWINKDDEVKMLRLSVNGYLSNRNVDPANIASLWLTRDAKGELLDLNERQRLVRASLQVQGLEDYLAKLRDQCKAAVQRKTSLLLRIGP